MRQVKSTNTIINVIELHRLDLFTPLRSQVGTLGTKESCHLRRQHLAAATAALSEHSDRNLSLLHRPGRACEAHGLAFRR